MVPRTVAARVDSDQIWDTRCRRYGWTHAVLPLLGCRRLVSGLSRGDRAGTTALRILAGLPDDPCVL